MTDDLSEEVEAWWRQKFADEIETLVMGLEDDEATKWFNSGIQYAAMFVRHRRDDRV